MKLIYSKINPEKLLHIVYRYSEIKERTDIAPENQFLQVSSIKQNKGKKYRAHEHIWKDPKTDQVIAQESWIVVDGSVKVYMYDLDGSLLNEDVITRGDCSITFEGGHNYEIMEDNTIVYEYKTGPYEGVKNDKVFFDEKYGN